MSWNPFKIRRREQKNTVYPEAGSDRLKKSMDKFMKVIDDIDALLLRDTAKESDDKDDRRPRPIHH